jgi:hypothetical protein
MQCALDCPLHNSYNSLSPWLLIIPGKLAEHTDGQNYVTLGEVLIKLDRGISIVMNGHSNDVSQFVISYVNKNEAKMGAGI